MGKGKSLDKSSSEREVRSKMRHDRGLAIDDNQPKSISKVSVTPVRNMGQLVETNNRKSRSCNVVDIKSKGKRVVDDDFVDEGDGEDNHQKLCLGGNNNVSEVETFYISKDIVFTKPLRFTKFTVQDIGQQLKKYLSDVQLNMFRKTCFGHFIDLPHLYLQNQLIRHLMLREIPSDKPDTFTILINDTRLEFGMREFSIISGLKCYGDETCDYDPKTPNRLMSSYFPNQSKVKKQSLIDVFEGRRWLDDNDAVKISVLYVIYTFILSGGDPKKSSVDRRHFELVESGAFERYPWGKDSFKELYKTVSQKLRATVGYYKLGGLPLVLQVWFYECCSKVDPTLAIPVATTKFPRILKWKVLREDPFFEDLKEVMFKGIGNEVLFSNFNPTAAEIASIQLPNIDDSIEEDVPGSHIQGSGLSCDDFLSTHFNSRQQQQPSNDENLRRKVDYSLEINKLKSDVAAISSDLETFKSRVDDEFKDLRMFVTETMNKVIDQVNAMRLPKDTEVVGVDNLQFQNVHKDTDLREVPSPQTCAPVDTTGFSFSLGLTQQFQTQNHQSHDAFSDKDVEGAAVNVKANESIVPGSSKGVTLDDYDFPYNNSQLLRIDADIANLKGSGSPKVNVFEMRRAEENPSDDDDSEDEESGRNGGIPVVQRSQLVHIESDNENETPQQRKKRLRLPGRYKKSPFLPNLSSGETSMDAQRIFEIKYPFITPIGIEVNPYLQSEYVSWVDEGSTPDKRRKGIYRLAAKKIDPPFKLGVCEVDQKEWFHTLQHGLKPLCDEHIDVAFYYLRKKGKFGVDNPVKFTTTDCLFKVEIQRMYRLFTDGGNDMTIVRKGDRIGQYIFGFALPASTPWFMVDYVLFPINMTGKCHWVLAVLNIKGRCISVYDSLKGSALHDVELCDVINWFAIMLPLYFSVTGFYDKRDDLHPNVNQAYSGKVFTDPFEVVYMENVPQQMDGSLDCGIFVAAYAEYFCCGYTVPPLDFDVVIYRTRLGTVLWDYARRKQEQRAISDPEDNIQQVRKKGRPKRKKFTVV